MRLKERIYKIFNNSHMTTKLKQLISAFIIILFITISSFVLSQQNGVESIQQADTVSSQIDSNTNSKDNKTDNNLEEDEDSQNFTMMSLNIVYYLFYKYLHHNDFNN